MPYKMKTTLLILTLNILCLGSILGQQQVNDFNKIKTGNWLDLSFRPLNEKGEEIAFNIVEEIPNFPGGYDSLAKFLQNTLEYPKNAIRDSIVGLVKTTFDIDQNGNVRNVVTWKGIRNDLDSACIAVISKMPKWSKPKVKNNEKVLIRFLLPIKFTIAKK